MADIYALKKICMADISIFSKVYIIFYILLDHEIVVPRKNVTLLLTKI